MTDNQLNLGVKSLSSRQESKILIKKNFPIFLAESFITFAVSGMLLTMLELSKIIFYEDEFRPLELGLIFTARTWSIAFSGLFFGMISDRTRRKPIFILILIICGIGRFINGYAPDDPATRFGFFIFCNLLIGIGQGGLMPVVLSYSNDAIELTQRSRFFGIYETFRQIFQILGMILGAWMLEEKYWKEYFWLTGIMMFICAILVAFFISEPKRGMSQNQLKGVLINSEIQYKYQLNKETVKKTIFSRTNIVAFVEGIFTWIVFSTAMFLMYPYIQSPPYNISPTSSSILMIIFGMPGAILGSLAFARASDKLAEKNIVHRVNLIIFSIYALYIIIIAIFILPLPHLSISQGSDFRNLFQYWQYIVFGIILFVMRGVLGIYHINQNPILQKINLPEAQGTISAWNQFLETIGMGLGPLIAGITLQIYQQDYFLTAGITLLVGLPSAFLWVLARKWIHKDIAAIDGLLDKRAIELLNGKAEGKK
jgi:MFS family permease